MPTRHPMRTTTPIAITELRDGDLMVIGGDVCRVAHIQTSRTRVAVYQYDTAGNVPVEPVVRWRKDRIVRIGAGSERFRRRHLSVVK